MERSFINFDTVGEGERGIWDLDGGIFVIFRIYWVFVGDLLLGIDDECTVE